MVDHNDTDNSDTESWLRLEILSESPDADAARLMQCEALGVEVQDRDTFMENVEFTPLPDGQSRLIVFFEDRESTASLRRQVENTLQDCEIVSLARYSDRSWETAWMKYFEAEQISPRVAVGPPWDPPAAPDDGLAITIEPGMAFGTGTHETTRLCAKLIDKLMEDRPIESVLDVGCGSAILSMIAAGLGATSVVGIDVDDTAVNVARENIGKNGFHRDQIDLSTRPLEDIEQSFDLVVANILAPILWELRDSLLDAVARGGDLLLSGIADDQCRDLQQRFEAPHFELLDTDRDGEWVALHLRHCPT